MNPAELHLKALDLFDAVCDLPPDEREAFLSRHCTDSQLRERVESLLRHDDTSDSFINDKQPAEQLDAMAAQVFGADAKDFPHKIGQYEVVRQIGEGGMGIIYEAQQESPRRRVALKVLRPGMVSRDMLKRFQHEAHILGQLQHPGIAHIHEAGLADLPQGRQPFFVMEFIDGESLNRFVEARQLETHQRLELLARVCDAVQHAHQKGIIHRDLKPSNVLVVSHSDGTSTGTLPTTPTGTATDVIGQPKVLDFGIARVTDADLQAVTVHTEVGQLVGTLAYMSPEQIEGDSADLDTRCDVYALGVILYQLLTGRRPFDLTGKPVTEAARMIREVEPTPVGEIDRTLRGDVETIVAKAMDKDRGRRYASAAEFAADIRRFITNQPIDARPASTFYQFTKFATRNKGLVTGLALTLAMLLVALAGTGYGLLQANKQRDKAVAANERLESVVEYQSAMLKHIDVAEMGRRIFADIKSEALTVLSGIEDADARFAHFERILSRVNETTIASRSLDVSIMSQAVAALDTGFADQPVLQADLRASLAEIYGNIGLAEKSLLQARAEWETRRKAIGDEHPDTFLAKQRIIEMLRKIGSFEEAEQAARELLEAQRRILGGDHVDTLQTQHLLGQCLVDLTRPQEAVSELEGALTALERTVGADHAVALSTRRTLGTHYFQERHLDKARSAFEAVLHEYEDQLGPKDSETLSILGHIAQVYFMQNDFETALEYMERIDSTLTDTKGADHPDTLAARRHLANSLTEMGRFEEAEPIMVDALARSRRVLGTDHPSTVSALAAGLRLMMKSKRWEEAQKYGLEAITISERTLGPDNIRTLDARGNLATVYLKSENHETAVRHAESTLDEYKRVLGQDHHRALGMQQLYAKILMSAGKLEVADSVLQDALPRYRAHHPNSTALAGTLGLRVTTLVNLNRGGDAEPLARELLEWCERVSAPKGTLGRCHLWIARTQFAQARLMDADRSLTTAIGLLTAGLPATHWSVQLARLMQHVIAYRAGDPERATDAFAAYEDFVASKESMKPEERNTLLPEVRRMMLESQIDPGALKE